ncbi:HD domain-containing protein [Methanoculleus sp. Wushi-C6]|uniref:HD domain-containing protein n=1 Tax=Methanoculleus caldifontis TaxID=2651577 RepID=A0ABU3X1H2_9EURY|nr:HD domain-containing protein [Methanoculleus sp. Wushi-C6]MDV2481898.1 HD domain-containing protein [Methanoculleus sp. Wushi-C6]
MDQETAAMLDHVRNVLQDSGAHGFDHTLRVVRLCEEIGAREGADMKILIPAAVFHDIARPLEERTGVPHEEEGARMAAEYLEAAGCPADLIAGIVHAIHAHRYSTGIEPGTLEARILSDADNLDAMGAVGIARTFMQAGERGTGIADAADHFHDKLLNLKDRMYTGSAREIAGRRHALLVAFLEALEDEAQTRPLSVPERK